MAAISQQSWPPAICDKIFLDLLLSGHHRALDCSSWPVGQVSLFMGRVPEYVHHFLEHDGLATNAAGHSCIQPTASRLHKPPSHRQPHSQAPQLLKPWQLTPACLHAWSFRTSCSPRPSI